MTTRALLIGIVAGAAVTPLAAQRETVLKQIAVPHSYYFREMYLPQVTTGPGWVAWMPDGRSVVYSMAGTLWRQTLGSDTATQLTDGPGYDYQPDVSPDGRRVVYSSYRNDQVELRVLDLTTGAESPLVSNQAVNVEPRWSPDGSKVVFVSTAFEGRWHVFTLEDGAGRVPVRITTDHDSGLPRYYYGPFDHFISPTWSPDGRELILVSNAGRIWGSGGFWRMDARPGAVPRPIWFEETTWKGRPDWSRDGKRVVYSSYLGRQWNQLWLMTGEGGDPFQLTYGSFDVTNPRWSPDATKIAFISNRTGNTALQVISVPGGDITTVAARIRRYRTNAVPLTISVVDRTGRPIAARVSVTGPDGRGHFPADAWAHADDGFDRADRRFEFTYFHSAGSSRLDLPAGRYIVETTKGLEYAREVDTVTVTGRPAAHRVRLRRLIDFPAQGWYSGDLHAHMNYGGHYRNTLARLRFQAEAEDLHVVENLVVNKEARVPDIEYFGAALDPVSTATTLIKHDQEYHTSYWGHSSLLGLTRHFVMPAYAGYTNTAAASLFPHNTKVFEVARSQGGITGYVHPFESVPDFSKGEITTIGFPVDAALGKIDYLEIVGFSDHLATAEIWYRLLNTGIKLPAGAGTDAMANYASLRGPVGMGRVFVQSGTLDYRRWLAALKAGRTMVSNGPLLTFTLGGQAIGSTFKLPAGRHRLVARLALRSIVEVDSLQVIQNGRVVHSVDLGASRTSADATVSLTVEQSSWFSVRAFSRRARHPALDIYPFGTTSPIYVEVGGTPIWSAADAGYFLQWLDQLVPQVERHPGWNSAAERDEVLADIARARAVFSSPSGRRPTAVTVGTVSIARGLSKLGVCSRAEGERLVEAGRVTVGGRVVREIGHRVRPETDVIAIDGVRVGRVDRVYLALNKPRGLVTTRDDPGGRPTIYQCLTDNSLPFVGPVGRLDKASEGLLLLTNDTRWSARLLDPVSHVDKTYHVQVRGLIDETVVAAVAAGVVERASGERLSVKQVTLLRVGSRSSAWLEIVLDEGKNRHIRRLVAELELEVLRLVRVAIGPLALGALAKGAWRLLTTDEVGSLAEAGSGVSPPRPPVR